VPTVCTGAATGPPEPGHGTRRTPVRRRPDSLLSTRPPTPRDHAGPFGAREVDDRAVDSTSSRPTPIEIPIPPVCFNSSPSVPP
jgi:hypothetical protein